MDKQEKIKAILTKLEKAIDAARTNAAVERSHDNRERAIYLDGFADGLVKTHKMFIGLIDE